MLGAMGSEDASWILDPKHILHYSATASVSQLNKALNSKIVYSY